MGYKDITAGDKIGKAKAMRFINTKEDGSGTPGMEVAFEFEEPSTGNREHLSRVFWMSEGAKKYSVDTLTNVLGFDANFMVTNDNGDFTDPRVLDFNREVKLVVEVEDAVTKDDFGNLTPKINTETGEVMKRPVIKWVNSIGGSAFAGVKPEVAKQQLSAFKGDFLAAKQSSPQQKPATPQGQGVPNMAPGANGKPLPF